MSIKIIAVLCFLAYLTTAFAADSNSGNVAQISNIQTNVNNITAVPSSGGLPSGTNVPGASSVMSGNQDVVKIMSDPCTWTTMGHMAKVMMSMQEQNQGKTGSN